MFLLLLIISSIVWIVFSLLYQHIDENFGCTVIIISIIVFVISLIGTLYNGINVVNSRYIDKKIVLYEEQNTEIETEINTIVENYMKFEAETYGKFKFENADGMALIQLYPELKSDELIKQQMQLHTENNANIKKLKEKQINCQANKWWLYFGG